MNLYTEKQNRNYGGEPLNKWMQQHAEYVSLLKEIAESHGANLRFDRKAIAASDIAEQFFCEKKVEMQYLYGEIETEAKIVGIEAHGNLLEDTVRVQREELWRKIYSKEPVLVLESLFFAKFGDIIVAGKPDSVLFKNGLPLLVMEYKFSKSSVVHQTHHVQARIYGLLLNKIGFDTRSLLYAVIIANPTARSDRELKRKAIEAIIKNGLREETLELGNARVFLHTFNQGDAEKDLEWAIKFWKQERAAIPTQNLNKCKTCEFFEKCQS